MIIPLGCAKVRMQMAIPDYQTLMKPLLVSLADGSERGFSELVPALAIISG